MTGEIIDNGVGRKVRSGSVVFTARAITDASLRATIVASEFEADDGISISDESNDDFVYTIYVSGGQDGQDYGVRHQITLSGATAESPKREIIVPVRD